MAQSVDVRWNTEREGEVTLDAIRAFVAEVAGDLDAGSRYIRELNAALDAATSVDDYLARLDDRERLDAFRRDGSQSSKGERGRSWLDAETWAAMDPFERTLSNLLTGETRMMWAGDGAPDFACLAEVLSDLPAPRRALSIPCSTGKEAFSLAIAALRADIELSIVGVDRQPAYVKRASSGLLVPHWRDRDLPDVDTFLLFDPEHGTTQVTPEVLACCNFEQGDVLTGELPPGPFPLVLCRNLLGYFRGETLTTALTNVLARLAPGGTLLVDPFVTDGEEMAPARALLAERGLTRRFEAACFYSAPAS